MQRVEDILDLKFCTDGVQTALQDEDYEKVSNSACGSSLKFLLNICRMPCSIYRTIFIISQVCVLCIQLQCRLNTPTIL